MVRPFSYDKWILRLVLYVAAIAAISLVAALYLISPEAPAEKRYDYWESAQEEIDRSINDIIAQDKIERKEGYGYKKFISGDRTKKKIALTFDDGPHPKLTRDILDILDRYRVKATFFVVGKQALQYPHLIKMQKSKGHSIGNHTYNHVDLTSMDEQTAATEIKACGKTIRGITGKAPHLFRPPGGNYNRSVIRLADTLGYTTVLWTANAGDTARISKSDIWGRLFSRIENGGVILMHNGGRNTAAILPRLIEKLRSDGYEFVTVDELIEDSRKGPDRSLNLERFLSKMFPGWKKYEK